MERNFLIQTSVDFVNPTSEIVRCDDSAILRIVNDIIEGDSAEVYGDGFDILLEKKTFLDSSAIRNHLFSIHTQYANSKDLTSVINIFYQVRTIDSIDYGVLA